MQTKISVIMGIHNQTDRKALEVAIDSVLTQTMREFEFLIYDDGSRAEEVAYLQNLVEKDSRIKLIKGEKNLGLAHGLNQCLNVAKGEFIARMDADDVSVPERFQIQRSFLEKHPEIAYAGCAAFLFDEKGTWGRREMPNKPKKQDFLRFSPYIHPSVMFRSSVLKNVGGYLETKDTRRCEDYELFMRLHSMGYMGYNMEQALLCYRESRDWYDKRTIAQRIAEMKIRYRGFKTMGILSIKNWIYVVKPVVMIVLPKKMRRELRRKNIKGIE